jgi:hypothetical protein
VDRTACPARQFFLNGRLDKQDQRMTPTGSGIDIRALCYGVMSSLADPKRPVQDNAPIPAAALAVYVLTVNPWRRRSIAVARC